MAVNTLLELISVVCGILYLLLMVREHIACWIFGILGSLITIYLYTQVTLYLEAGLNVYYVLAGFYGWYFWHKQQDSEQQVPVLDWKLRPQIIWGILCLLIGLGLGKLMEQYSNSERPYIDALITTFSFLATYMEARKVLSTWYYWFVLNACSIFLQIDRGLYYLSMLSVVYTIMSITGYLRWKRSMLQAATKTAGSSI